MLLFIMSEAFKVESEQERLFKTTANNAIQAKHESTLISLKKKSREVSLEIRVGNYANTALLLFMHKDQNGLLS